MLKLMSVLDAAPLPVFVADEGMYYVYENDAAERFLGYGRAEIIGKRLTDLVVYDRRLTTSPFQNIRRSGHLSGRVQYRHRDGSMRDADVNAFAQSLADDSTVIVSLVHPMHRGPGQAPVVFHSNSDYGFTNDQVRLLQLMADGFSDESITVLLSRTEGEVARQVQEVLAKMNASSRTEAAVVAIKKGVLL